MSNPYKSIPEQGFWKKGVFEKRNGPIWPMMNKTFRIQPSDQVATAGSCFAQNVAKHLRHNPRVNFYSAEELRDEDPVYSGRYGNIYTAHQLLQLFNECESGVAASDCAVLRNDARYVDVHRPYMEPDGFATAQDVVDARTTHIAAVRSIFRKANILVFTLGLTEAWWSPSSGEVFPTCPGVYSDECEIDYEFKNFSVGEVSAAMDEFIEALLVVNPHVKVLLTVSPVPLTATYTDDHILVATMNSKSILRVACGELVEKHAQAYYLPSYEMISNPYTADSAYDPDSLREIQPEPIAEVMEFFESEYLAAESDGRSAVNSTANGATPDNEVLCDDLEIEKSMGF